MGNTTDILLATVVMDIPASLDERAITKKNTIKRTPMITEMGIHGASRIAASLIPSALIRKPKVLAVR